MKSKAMLFVLLLVALMLVSAANAAPILAVQQGPATMVFSNFTTLGTAANPWLVSFTINAVAPTSYLVFSTNTGHSPVGGNGVAADNSQVTGGFSAGRWVQFTITNNTGFVWTSLQAELEIKLGLPSLNGDGLSWAQGSGNSASSPSFSVVTQIDNTKDYRNFSGGSVANGASVVVLMPITDNGLNNPFYIAWDPNRVDVPEPVSYALTGLGLLSLGLIRRTKKKK